MPSPSPRTAATALVLIVLIMSATLTNAAPGPHDCSLNGVWDGAACKCDKPWTGPECGVLEYATTPASGKSLCPESDTHNTWNGAIIEGPDGVYHLYNPLYAPGALGAVSTTTMLHGTANNIAGPYTWGAKPNIPIDLLHSSFDGPKSVVYQDSVTNKTMYSLWLGGGVYLAESVDGPFTKVDQLRYPGSNPAPFYHDGLFYYTNSPCQTVWTTPRLVPGAKWTVHGTIDHTDVPAGWIPEDSDLWVDKKGNFHIINHAYNPHEWDNCSSSVLSSHFFSKDAKTWSFYKEGIQPYSHTVKYDDGSSFMFVTMERPNVYLDKTGQLTHIHLAADLVDYSRTKNCAARANHSHYGHCPCDNCKYEDHGGTTIIALAVN